MGQENNLYVNGNANKKAFTGLSLNSNAATTIFNYSDGSEKLRFMMNGDVFIKGNLATTDIEIVNGLRDMLGIGKVKNIGQSNKSIEALTEYIQSLELGSFERWTSEEVSGYLTACRSIKKYYEELKPSLTALEEENARLREALEIVMHPKLSTDMDTAQEEWNDILIKAEQALTPKSESNG